MSWIIILAHMGSARQCGSHSRSSPARAYHVRDTSCRSDIGPRAPHGQRGNARQMEQVMCDRLTCVLSAHPRGAPAVRERKRAPKSGRAGALTDRHASERASSSMSVAFKASLCSRKRPTTGAGRPCCPRARWTPSAAGRPREPGTCAPSSLACGSSGRPKRAPAPMLLFDLICTQNYTPSAPFQQGLQTVYYTHTNPPPHTGFPMNTRRLCRSVNKIHLSSSEDVSRRYSY